MSTNRGACVEGGGVVMGKNFITVFTNDALRKVDAARQPFTMLAGPKESNGIRSIVIGPN